MTHLERESGKEYPILTQIYWEEYSMILHLDMCMIKLVLFQNLSNCSTWFRFVEISEIIVPAVDCTDKLFQEVIKIYVVRAADVMKCEKIYRI